MVMTILEAHVKQENWAALEEAYREGITHDDAGLVQTFLIHNMRETDIWRILTIWRSREALEAMRRSNETPRGVLIFRAAQAEPALSIFEVNQQAMKGG